jgi:hypothetical protein
MLSVLAVSQYESCAGVDLRNRQGLLAFQYENEGRLHSNPVQEFHDQVDLGLHHDGPHQDGSHWHGEASESLWPLAINVCRLSLWELVDSFGKLLSEGLVAVLVRTSRKFKRWGPSCASNQPSVLRFLTIIGGEHHCISGSQPRLHICCLAIHQEPSLPRRVQAFPLVSWVYFQALLNFRVRRH